MSEAQSVRAYRVERMRRAPRNWTYWVAFFTLLNGVFLGIGQDILILAGLVAPFLVGGAWPHFVAALVLAALAFHAVKLRWLLIIGLLVYVADAILAIYLGLWAGMVMHILVLVFVGFALLTARSLSRQVPATQGDAT